MDEGPQEEKYNWKSEGRRLLISGGGSSSHGGKGTQEIQQCCGDWDIMSLHFYLKDGDRVLLVSDAPLFLDHKCELVVDHCYLTDVLHVGRIYDMIVFPKMPADGILRKAIEKVCGGGHVIILGIEDVVERAGYQVIKGNPGPLVLRRPLELSNESS